MVQVYVTRKSGATDDIMKALQTALPRVPLQQCDAIGDIKADQPVVVLIQTAANIEDDLNNVTTELKDIHVDMVAILVIHVKPRRAALPKTKTIDSLEDQKYKTYGLVVDLAYHNGSFYTHQINTDGMRYLKDFLKAKSPDIINTSMDVVDQLNDSASLLPSQGSSSNNNVQVYVPMEPVSIIGFINALQDQLPNFDFTPCERPGMICPKTPLVVLLQRMADTEEDITNAVYNLNDIPNHIVAVAVIHAVESDHLPTSASRDTLSDKRFEDFGLIVDFAYNNEAIYDHQMNKDGIKSLTDFLQKYSKDNVQTPDQVQIDSEINDVIEDESAQSNIEYGATGNSDTLRNAVLQFCHSPAMQIDIMDEVVKNEFLQSGLDFQDVKVIQLSDKYPWVIMCEDGDYVYKAVEEVKDIFKNQKLIIVSNRDVQTPVQRDSGTWIEIKCVPDSAKNPVVEAAVQKFKTLLKIT